MIVPACTLAQIFQLSSLLELHHGLSSNCEDLVIWLPEELALQIFSYLDPVSLCRACQVRAPSRPGVKPRPHRPRFMACAQYPYPV